MEEIEFVEANEERKDGRILLREDTEKVTDHRTCKIEEASLPLRKATLDIEEHRKEVEHSSQGTHPLDDVGYRLGLDGMADEEEAREEGDGEGYGSVAFFKGREV